ncbi:hypothetical protein KPH14_012937, partial [Odynerus spinipes]
LGIDEPGFTHITSFRRQVFIDPDDIEKLPKEFTINYEETLYHIYVSTDKITCFVCKQDGHTAKYCKVNTGNITTQVSYCTNQYGNKPLSEPRYEGNETNNIIPHNLDNSKDINSGNKQLNQLEFNGTNLFKKPIINESSRPSKRPVSISTAPDDGSKIDSEEEIVPKQVKKGTNKKKKIVHAEIPPEEYLKVDIKAAKIIIPEAVAATFPMTYEEFFEFICNSYKYKYSEIRSLAIKYVTNIPALVVMLEEIYKSIKIREIKLRITKIVKHLQNETM